MVGTGSVVRKSTMIRLHSGGLLVEQPVRRAGDHCELGVGNAPIHRDRMLEFHLVVIANHYQGLTRHCAQLGAGERWLFPIQARQLPVHYREVVGTVG
jgi:hypothetical protein